MFAFLSRYLAYRQLKPVVSALPRRLVRAFGPGKSYTFLQAKQAISDLRLRKTAEPYAYAVTCNLEELQKNGCALSAHEYHTLRAQLVGLFDLRGPDFTVTNLLATPYAKHCPAPANPDATLLAGWVARSWGGSWGVAGAGLTAVSTSDSFASADSGGSGGCDGGGGC